MAKTTNGNNGQTLSTQAYNILKNDILDMNLRPGEVIMVQSLATQLSLSRTPVKEALVRLAQEGLVESTKGRKYKIAPLKMGEIVEIYDIRIALECICAEIAAEIITPEQVAQLRTIHADTCQALEQKDYHTMFNGDSDFHNALSDIAGKHVSKDILIRLGTRIQRIRFLNTYVPGRLEQTMQEHQEILDALAAHESQRVKQALTHHLTQVKAVITDLLQNRKFEFPQLRWIEITP